MDSVLAVDIGGTKLAAGGEGRRGDPGLGHRPDHGRAGADGLFAGLTR
ncbi:MAG: hypothetical protein WKF43_03705 [Acidimicrobiales bacterium]